MLAGWKTVVPVTGEDKTVQVFWEQFGIFIKMKDIYILWFSNSFLLCPLWRNKCIPEALGRYLSQHCLLEHEITQGMNEYVVWAERDVLSLFLYCWKLLQCIQVLILKNEFSGEKNRWQNEFMCVKNYYVCAYM